MLRVLISKTYGKMNNYRRFWKFEAFLPIQCKRAVLSSSGKICQKYILLGLYFFNSANKTYLRFINLGNMRERQRSSNKSGHTNVYITINGQLKMLPCHFCSFQFSNFKRSFDKNFMKRATIFQLLPNFYYLAKF